MKRLKEGIERLLQLVKDILFPFFCVVCNEEGTLLCERCLSSLSLSPVWRCPVCKKESPSGVTCESCHSVSFLDSVSSVAAYEEGEPVARLIHELKYNSIEEVTGVLEQIFLSVYPKEKVPFCDVIISIPLHKKRLAKRGFNQSELIASFLSANLHIPLDHGAKRIRFTHPQVGLSGEERKKNLHEAFQVNSALQGKKVLLVDDVFTTGSTLQECAKALKEAGAQEVHGFTFARAVSA